MESDTARHPQSVTDRNFAASIRESGQPVLVNFWAPWCHPCLAMAAVVNNLSASYAGSIRVVKCNVDKSPVWSTRCGIQSIPTLILFNRGKPIKKIIGLVPAERIKKTVDYALAGSNSIAHPAAVSI